MTTAYLRAVAYRQARSPLGRISHGIGWGQAWATTPELQHLAWTMNAGGTHERFDPYLVAQRQEAETALRALAAALESKALLGARTARRALVEAKAQTDALEALAALDRAEASLIAAAQHKGQAVSIRHDLAVVVWQDAQAREALAKPAPKRRGPYRKRSA